MQAILAEEGGPSGNIKKAEQGLMKQAEMAQGKEGKRAREGGGVTGAKDRGGEEEELSPGRSAMQTTRRRLLEAPQDKHPGSTGLEPSDAS